MLSREDVEAIIVLVESDAPAAQAINDALGDNAGVGKFVPDKLAGGFRNLTFLLGGKTQNDSDTHWRICIGIADSTSALINAYRRKRPGLRRILKAGTVTRNINAMILPEHTATSIHMQDGQVHVMDWHATLTVRNPLLFRTINDFHADRSIAYKDWRGWN